ncbi:MAG TPA: hypothetical protein VFE55_04250, partial [Acidimicrobiia bacterium]|nr:hypothetical protein [Acidimicrobiia bacterium]
MSFHLRTPRRQARRSAIAGLTALAALALVAPSPVQAAGPRAAAVSGTAAATGTTASGYWMVGSDGHVYPFGAAADLGSPVLPAGARATHIEPTPDGGGYY